MAKTMTPSQDPATSEQIDKLADQVRHAARKAGLTEDQAQAVLGQGKSATRRIMNTIQQIASEISGTLIVTVDYARSIASLIQEASFDWKHVGLDPDRFPVAGDGESTQNVDELHLDRTITNTELLDELVERGLEFADPQTALTIACQYPNRQRKHPLVILFKDSNGLLWYLILSVGDGGRELVVGRSSPDGSWGARSRFLVVRKSD